MKVWLISLLLILAPCVNAEEFMNYNQRIRCDFVDHLSKSWGEPRIQTFSYSTKFLDWDKYDNIEFQEEETDSKIITIKAGVMYRPSEDVYMVLGAQLPIFIIGDVSEISAHDRFFFGDFDGYDGFGHGRFGFTFSMKY